jgi:hypothetical protein
MECKCSVGYLQLSARIPFELLMVTFKNNEYLRRICETAEAKRAINRQR